jgi:hypothetical protein
MRTNVIITDDFYSNPDLVRSFALQQEFDVRGNFPGTRTKCFLTEDVKNTIQNLVGNVGGNVTEWYAEDGLSGSFEIATSQNRTWIHTDHFNNWAGVLYLTPNPPHTGGTGLYRHKETGNYTRVDKDYEGYDYTKWDLHDVIGNRYNRLAMYRSDIFHASIDYFGDSLENGRLFQLFFFNTKY